jgi:hypothetical protein
MFVQPLGELRMRMSSTPHQRTCIAHATAVGGIELIQTFLRIDVYANKRSISSRARA